MRLCYIFGFFMFSEVFCIDKEQRKAVLCNAGVELFPYAESMPPSILSISFESLKLIWGGWGLWKAIQGIPHNQLKELVQWFLSVKRTKWTAGLTHRYYFSSLNLLYNLLTSKHSSLIFLFAKEFIFIFQLSHC